LARRPPQASNAKVFADTALAPLDVQRREAAARCVSLKIWPISPMLSGQLATGAAIEPER